MIKEMLVKYRSPRNFKELPDYTFFKENKLYLSAQQWLKNYLEINNETDLIFANILIRSLANKQTLERGFEMALTLAKEKYTLSVKQKQFIEEKMENIRRDLPSFEVDGHQILIPFFDRATNLVYSEQIEKLDKYPYSLLKDQFKDIFVDPFETYSFALFESPFASLVFIGADKSSRAYFCSNWDTLYFINDQGTVDYFLPLFDKYLKEVDRRSIVERLKPVVEAYYQFDKKEMIVRLFNGRFISSRVYHLLLRKIGEN